MCLISYKARQTKRRERNSKLSNAFIFIPTKVTNAHHIVIATYELVSRIYL